MQRVKKKTLPRFLLVFKDPVGIYLKNTACTVLNVILHISIQGSWPKKQQQQSNDFRWGPFTCLISHITFVCLQHNIMLQRRREGVKPDMPTAAERQELLAQLGGKPY